MVCLTIVKTTAIPMYYTCSIHFPRVLLHLYTIHVASMHIHFNRVHAQEVLKLSSVVTTKKIIRSKDSVIVVVSKFIQIVEICEKPSPIR